MKEVLYRIVFLIGFFIASCSPISDKVQPLSEFIRGEWEGHKQKVESGRNYQIVYRINFQRDDKLSFITTSSGTDDFDYSDEYTYQLIDERILQVQSRRVAGTYNWEVERSHEKLKLCFAQNDCVLFVRKNYFIWWLIILSLLVIVGLLIHVGFRKKRVSPF